MGGEERKWRCEGRKAEDGVRRGKREGEAGRGKERQEGGEVGRGK